MVGVSVVVPTVGRATLRAVLSALSRQTRDTPSFEVLVVSDGLPLPDLDDVARHTACLRFVYLRLPEARGVSAARNLGIENAEGTVVAFLDDDVTPGPSWVRSAANAVSPRTAVTGRIIEDDTGSTLSKLRRLAFDHRYRIVTAQPNPLVDFLSGGNCAVHRNALRDVGGFDEAFPKSQDRELARRLIRHGHSIAYASELTATHRGDYTWPDLWRGRYAAGRANAILLRDGDTTAVGPSAAIDTYGKSLAALLISHGPRLAAAAATAVAAEQLGRRSRTT